MARTVLTDNLGVKDRRPNADSGLLQNSQAVPVVSFFSHG